MLSKEAEWVVSTKLGLSDFVFDNFNKYSKENLFKHK